MSFIDCKLGDVFDIVRGGSPRPIEQFITNDSRGYNWIMIGDVADGSKYITQTKKRVLRTALSKSRMVKPGDFLLTNSMSFGKPYITQVAGCIHDGWLALTPKHPDKTDHDYFYHLLGSPELKREFERRAAGAVVKNLNIGLVKDVDVRIPASKAEQRRIAAILDKADAIRRKREQELALADDFLRSVFLEMFGDPASNPKEWPISLIDDLGDVQGGLQVSSKRAGDLTLPYLRVANVFRDRLALSEIKEINLTDGEFRRTRLEEGDILIVEGHGNPEEIGRAAIWDASINPCVHQNHLIRFRANRKRALPDYIARLLNSNGGRQQLIGAGRTTSGLNTISTRKVKEVTVPLPPLELQQRFAQVVEKQLTLSAKITGQLSLVNAIFASLSQRAFRGEL